MNNFCTNCGKKLKEKVIKCDECNTYVINLKVINKKKVFFIMSIIIGILILGIIIAICFYNLYYKNLNKSLYNKYLKDNFKDAQYMGYNSCLACDGSCDGGCINSPKIVGCFKYHYKSNPNIEDSDITIIYNRGNISIDTYSNIINKYGFKELKDEDEDEYGREIRSDLGINVNYIGSNNISKIYKMVNELIETYKKDTRNNFYVYIKDSNYNGIIVSNRDTNSKFKFEWEFEDDIKLINPTLGDVVRIYKPYGNIYNSLDDGNFYND